MTSNRFIYYILAIFIAGNLLLIFLQYNSSKNINHLVAGNEKVLNEFKVEAELRDLRKNIVTVETAIGKAVNTKDTAHISGLQQEINAIDNNIGKLQKVDDNDSCVKYIDQLDELVHKKIYFNNRALKILYQQGKEAPDTLINNARGKELTDSIAFITHKIDSSRRRLLTEITSSVDSSGQKARRWGTVLFIVAAVSGAILFWFIISRVRRQNQLIIQLDASEKQVKESSRIKENFMANMSHEIRTPMNAILGFAGLLQKKNMDEDSSVYIRSIQKSGETLLAIINDILDLSKIEAGMMRIESVPFSIREMLHSIETMFHEKTREKNLQLSVSVQQNVPAILEGDATRLTQILVNLIGNAIKFTDAGSIKIEVTTPGISGNFIQVCFVVTDTGTGIEKDKLSRIFERFRQAEASITRKYGGTGLGLSIVKDLVMLQKGSIDVQSEPGKGSSFRFIIPYKIPPVVQPVSAIEVKGNPEPAYFSNGRILIVEDNEMNQVLMKHLLQQWKISFAIVNSGQKAINLLKEEKFDLVLMDIQMPEMDGYNAAQEIRRGLKSNIAIVAMTAHVMAGEKEKCISYGMNDYLSKPIQERELTSIIAQYIKPPVEQLSTEKNMLAQNIPVYNCINLSYMREISNGNIDYEKDVTAQFIEVIPADIAALETALHAKNSETIKQVAHNMKTTVSIMGLTSKLGPLLNAIEYEDINEETFNNYIASLKKICAVALDEARLFYAAL